MLMICGTCSISHNVLQLYLVADFENETLNLDKMKKEVENLNEQQNPQLNIGAVSGSISIVKFKTTQMHITSKSNFFSNEVVMTMTDDALIFRVAGLDDRNTKKPYLQNGQYHLTIQAETKEGKFDFDVDESDCDRVVIYCR